MAVEFVTKDAEALKQVRALYDSAKERGMVDGAWALLGQAFLHPETVLNDAVRVRVMLVNSHWHKKLSGIIKQMVAAEKRREKRASKPKRKKSSNDSGAKP